MVTSVHFSELRDASLFKHVSDAVLAELSQHCRYREISAGETLFHQDDKSDRFFILRDGQVHVLRNYPDGQHVILATEGPYYVIGELSMLIDEPRTGTVVAVSDCTLVELKRSDLEAVCEHQPELAMQMMHYLGQRLYRMNLLVREHAIGNVAARLASLLLLTGAGGTETRVSRIARAVATDADTVDRLLRQWADAAYIIFDGRVLTILDAEALQTIAG